MIGASMRVGPSRQFTRMMEGKITPERYAAIVKRAVNARMNRRVADRMRFNAALRGDNISA